MTNPLAQFRSGLFGSRGVDVAASLEYVDQLASASTDPVAVQTAARVLLNTVIGAVDQILNSRSPERLALIELIVNTTDMPKLMAWADIAVVAGGSTSWELAFMGLPSLVFTFAENQKEIALAIENTGLGVNLGWANEESYKKLKNVLGDSLSNAAQRKKISDLGKNLIDGMGCSHICKDI